MLESKRVPIVFAVQCGCLIKISTSPTTPENPLQMNLRLRRNPFVERCASRGVISATEGDEGLEELRTMEPVNEQGNSSFEWEPYESNGSGALSAESQDPATSARPYPPGLLLDKTHEE